jgi:hypothetical protein
MTIEDHRAKRWRRVLVLSMLGNVVAIAAPLDGAFNTGTWQIRGTPVESRWIEVHKVDEWNGAKIYHIEVLGRGKGNPAWHLRHLLAHMAITETALRRSVVRQSRERAVYPETFDGGYAEWRQLNASGRAQICERSVEECMTVDGQEGDSSSGSD